VDHRWDLVLEYTVVSATVAHGWSALFPGLHRDLRDRDPPRALARSFDYDPSAGHFVSTGRRSTFAVIITLVVTAILVKGIRESATFNTTMVGIKLAVVLLVIVVGAFYVDPQNWKPFATVRLDRDELLREDRRRDDGRRRPPARDARGRRDHLLRLHRLRFGLDPRRGARNPQRDVPIGIVASLVVCTVLYIAVSAVLTGMVPHDRIDIDAPVSDAFRQVGLPWAQFLISLGALAGITWCSSS